MELPDDKRIVWRTYAGHERLAYISDDCWYGIPQGTCLGTVACVDSWRWATPKEIDAAWAEATPPAI